MLEGPGEEIRISRTKTGNLINTSLRSQSCVRGVAFSSMTGPLPHFRHRIKRSHQSNLSLSNTSLSQTSPPHFRHPLKRSHHSNLPAALSPPSQTSLSQTPPPHFRHPLKRYHHSNPLAAIFPPSAASVVPRCFFRLRRGRSEQGRRRARPWHRTRTFAPGSRTIHGTEVRWRRNVAVEDDGGTSRGYRGMVLFVCNGDEVLETVSSLSFPFFIFFLVVCVVSFVSSVDDLASGWTWTRTRRIVNKIWTSPFESTLFKTVVDEN